MLDNLHTQEGELGGGHGDRFDVVCWYFWKLLCFRTFGREEEVPHDDVGFLIQRWMDIKRAMENDFDLFGNPHFVKEEQYILWSPPVEGWLMLILMGLPRKTGVMLEGAESCVIIRQHG